ncbi:hypothetical protein ACJ72_04866 [Emergomyces africanus]|uniref:Uncharacterized protein n=1 Tax=Emergomyces africanus TaxID=1955775 RepID=A0A1B7NVL3_9EURO|nr:hypothetical protein ACJ72_04866 [Emergomyces africanus]
MALLNYLSPTEEVIPNGVSYLVQVQVKSEDKQDTNYRRQMSEISTYSDD